MPRVLLRPANEDFPRVAFDEEPGPAWRPIRADMLRICPQVDEDFPLLGLAIEEDPPAAWRPALPWAVRAPVYQDAEDVGVLGLALEDDWQRSVTLQPVTYAVTRHTDDDLPVTAAALAYEDEAGPLPRMLGWTVPPGRLAHEDDAPMLYGALEDDSWREPRPMRPTALPPPRAPNGEDVPVLHGVYEDDVWVRGVPPRREWQWWPPPPDGDWTPVPPGTVPPRAGLLLVAQNREGLALQRVAAMHLNLAASGRLALALVRLGPSQLSLSVVGRLSLSLTRSG